MERNEKDLLKEQSDYSRIQSPVDATPMVLGVCKRRLCLHIVCLFQKVCRWISFSHLLMQVQDDIHDLCVFCTCFAPLGFPCCCVFMFPPGKTFVAVARSGFLTDSPVGSRTIPRCRLTKNQRAITSLVNQYKNPFQGVHFGVLGFRV